jgi:hypothetical protein
LVAVVVPYRPGCPHRAAAWAWLHNRYEQAGYEVATAPGPAGGWCKARAVNDAIHQTTDDILVIADADVWCDGLAAAVDAVRDGARWAIPHHTVHRLTEASTAEFMRGETPSDRAEKPYKGRAGGGMVVITRTLWEHVPMDPRFVGWGGEDDSWNLAVSAAAGKAPRFNADLWHLWHPPQARINRGVGNEANRALQIRYLKARKHPDDMAALVAEARELLEVNAWP